VHLTSETVRDDFEDAYGKEALDEGSDGISAMESRNAKFG
jgi:hypothetical protein